MRSHIGYTRRYFRLELVPRAVADFRYQPGFRVLFYRVRRAVEFYRGVGQVFVFIQSSASGLTARLCLLLALLDLTIGSRRKAA